MKKVELVNGQFYHVYNRGVDKRGIFLERVYYSRFVTCLYEFNNANKIKNFSRNLSTELGQTSLIEFDAKRELLVDIICFNLIPNHYHFILRQLVDKGISKFMQKLGTGYTMYFNEKNERTGRLFESKYKVKLVATDEYLMHLSRYIHLNCVDIIQPKWEEEGIRDWDKVIKFLESYKWSSYLDYIGKTNFPSIINREPLKEYFKTIESYKKFVQSWMKDDIDKLDEGDLLIE